MSRSIALTILLCALPVFADDIEQISAFGQTPLSSNMSEEKNIIGSKQYVFVGHARPRSFSVNVNYTF